MASELPPILELEQRRTALDLEIEKAEKLPRVLALHEIQLTALKRRRGQFLADLARRKQAWH
jgi:hypothetical protein